MAEFVGTPAGHHRRFAVVASRFNQAIVERLMDGALDALVRHGVAVDDIDQIWVPGAWELPIAVRRLLASERYEGIVAVGAVIRGDTPHFDYVAGEAARGIAQAAATSDIPVAFGVLTTDTIEQALERAGTKAGNKGFDAAFAAIELATLYRALGAPKR